MSIATALATAVGRGHSKDLLNQLYAEAVLTNATVPETAVNEYTLSISRIMQRTKINE